MRATVWEPTGGPSREGTAVAGAKVATGSPGAGEAWTICPIEVGLAGGEAGDDVGGGVATGEQAASKTVRPMANLMEATFIMLELLPWSFRAGVLG